jgi:hypothetical protein
MDGITFLKELIRGTFLSLLIIAGSVATDKSAQAVMLVDGLGGPAGFGELAMPRNDDGSSNLLPLPFEIDFFGNTYNDFYINNNGNITFNGPVFNYTPQPFPVSNRPMIAPYWGDVDTRCVTCGEVYVAAPNADTVAVTWNNVGFFSDNSSLTNNFQLLLRNQGGGDFDIEFRYDRLEWTTGDASGGIGGLGGTPAQAGFDAGDGVNFFTIPGSQTAAVLNLQNTSNVSQATPGLWSFAIRSGAVPGSTPDNPLLPVINDEGFQFDFNVDLNQRIYIDPEIAVGYDYIVNSGPNFATVLLPTLAGDDGIYQIFGFNAVSSDFDVLLGAANAGVVFDFGAGGLDRFRVLGIDQAAMLDPTDGTAFVAGLTFVSAGQVIMSQIPIVFDTNPDGSVPEPASWMLLLLGLAAMVVILRRRRPTAASI